MDTMKWIHLASRVWALAVMVNRRVNEPERNRVKKSAGKQGKHQSKKYPGAVLQANGHYIIAPAIYVAAISRKMPRVTALFLIFLFIVRSVLAV